MKRGFSVYMLKPNLFVLWNFRKVLISAKIWTLEVCFAPLQNPFQAYTFLSENTPWSYCKREQTEIESSNFLPRWHLEGKFRIRTGIVLGNTSCLWKKRGNQNLSSYYLLWNKNTGNHNYLASCGCSSHRRMHFTGGASSLCSHYPSRSKTNQECKVCMLHFLRLPFASQGFYFQEAKKKLRFQLCCLKTKSENLISHLFHCIPLKWMYGEKIRSGRSPLVQLL